MKTKVVNLHYILGLAFLLLLAHGASFAQEGYFGATNSITRGETPLAASVAGTNTYSRSGAMYYGVDRAPVSCVQTNRVTPSKTGNLMLVHGKKSNSANSPVADEDLQISTCAVPRSSDLGYRSAPQNQVEYGGGGM